MVTFGEIKAEMVKRGWSSKQIAELLNIARSTAVSKLAGKTEWKRNEIEILCKQFNKNYDELFK